MKKPCVKCGKQIPNSALNCVFCSTRQPPPPLDEILLGLDKLPKESDDGFSDDLASSYATEPTLVGFSMQALADALRKDTAGETAAAAEPATAAAVEKPAKTGPVPHSTKVTTTMQAISLPADAPTKDEPKKDEPKKDEPVAKAEAKAAVAPSEPPPAVEKPTPEPRRSRPRSPAAAGERRALRTLQIGGAALLVILLLPAGSVSVSDRLAVLCGAPYLAFFGSLAASLFFILISISPLDHFSRFGLAALIGALAIAFNGWGLVGAWQGVVGAVAISVLAVQLLDVPAPVWLTRLAAAATLLVIVLPGPHGVPVAAALHMLGGGSHGRALLGFLILLPPVLAGLALLPELPVSRRLLAALILAWAPLALLTAGMLVGDELQPRLAFAVLCASVLAVVSLEEALRPAGVRARE